MTETERAQDRLAAAIMVLLVLTSVMLLSLFTRTAPHPPLEVVPFALAPFLGASLALGAAALWLARRGSDIWMALAFAATALVSFGPQKYFDPAFTRIWPAVLLAQGAVLVISLIAMGLLKKQRAKQP